MARLTALTVTELLTQLDIDPRRIAVERNLVVLKRAAFDHTMIDAEDQKVGVLRVGHPEQLVADGTADEIRVEPQ